MFFDAPNDGVDFTGVAVRPKPADAAGGPTIRAMKWYCGRLEQLVGDGYAVGGAISLADAMIYNTFAESSDETESPDSARC